MNAVVNKSASAYLHQVALADFRNYVHEVVALGSGLNIVFGANAQGKTNLLEAVNMIATTRLLRGPRDSEAIRIGAPKALIEAELADSGTLLGIEIQAGVRKKAFVNRLLLPRASDLIGRLPAVCFSAQALEIVRGEPSSRRLFLDLELSQFYPAYLVHLASYKRALDQRNALLKASGFSKIDQDHFDVWEAEMADHGVALRNFRRTFVSDLVKTAADLHRVVAADENLSISYDAAHSTPEELREQFVSSRIRDIDRGSTSVGPHRDLLTIEINGNDVRSFGSQGQQRSVVIALKLAVLRLGIEQLGVAPLLLLDDVFSDLDRCRRQLLVQVIASEAGQVVITCTEPEQVGDALLSNAKLLKVQSGRIEEQ